MQIKNYPLFYKFYHHTFLGGKVKYAYHYFKKNLLSDKLYLKLRFREVRGDKLNFKNPQTLNEKINWLKLYDRTSLHTKCADKYEVREYVKSKIGEEYLVPLYFHTENPTDVNASNIQTVPCIIKANHDSGGGIFIDSSDEVNWKEIQNNLKERLKNNYYKESREWQYKNIRPRIIVEKLLLDDEGQVPMDYKLHCLNGKVEIIQLDIDRFSNHKRNLYDTDWNKLPFTWSMWEDNNPLWIPGPDVNRPTNLKLLIELAEKLSEDFCYARIDFYEVNNRLYFGEITFHHGGGMETIDPSIWDKKLGERLTLTLN